MCLQAKRPSQLSDRKCPFRSVSSAKAFHIYSVHFIHDATALPHSQHLPEPSCLPHWSLCPQIPSYTAYSHWLPTMAQITWMNFLFLKPLAVECTSNFPLQRSAGFPHSLHSSPSVSSLLLSKWVSHSPSRMSDSARFSSLSPWAEVLCSWATHGHPHSVYGRITETIFKEKILTKDTKICT